MSDEVTGESLRRLIKEQKVIRDRNQSVPSAEALEELAGQIELLKATHGFGRLIARREQENVVRVLNELIKDLPAVIESTRKIVEYKKKHGQDSDPANKQISALERLTDSIDKVFKVGIGWRVFPPADEWHVYVRPLSMFVREALKKANPTLEFPAHAQGPLIRFLQIVIPLISGENPKAETIAAYLKRRTGVTGEVLLFRVTT